MTVAPQWVGPSSSSGGPIPSSGPQELPTLEQLLILVARAERKGGLDYAEGHRLRAGLMHFADQHAGRTTESSREVELRRKYNNARKAVWKLKRDAGASRTSGSPAAAPGWVDEQARDALSRVVELATRWTHIPAKRQAGVSVLSTIRNIDAE